MKRLMILVAMVALSGCASKGVSLDASKFYNGPEKPADEVGILDVAASIRSGGLFDGTTTRSRVLSINGDLVDKDIDEVKLLPGSYAVEVVTWRAEKLDTQWYENLEGHRKAEYLTIKAGQEAELIFEEFPTIKGARYNARIVID